MRIIQAFAFFFVFSFLGFSVCAAEQGDDHKSHHSDSASLKPDSKVLLVNKPMLHESVAQTSMEKMDAQMKYMQEMHEKMMNAKTPEERKAHMAEHMKTMQGGMAMMNDISKICATQKMDAIIPVSTLTQEKKSDMQCDKHSDMEIKQKMMEKRMEMMEAMMQMMIDRVNSESYDDYADRVLKK